MLKDVWQKDLEASIPEILQILSKDLEKKFEAQEIAEQLKKELEEINRCLEVMGYLKLVDLQVAFGPRYLVQITAMGLANKQTRFGAGDDNYE